MGKVAQIRRPVENKPKRYVLEWRNKWLTSEATSIVEMAAALRKAADLLDEMAKAGVMSADDSGFEDDYVILVTDNESVAKRFGLEYVVDQEEP